MAFDNSILTLVLNPGARPRPNPATGQPVSHCRERIEALIDRIANADGQVIVPTPSFAEALCAVPDLAKVVKEIRAYSSIELAAFDDKAAFELAEITREAFAAGRKKDGVDESWQRIKIDRQIVAIAKSRGATTLYTDDDVQATFAVKAQIDVLHSWDLELPEAYRQGSLLDNAQ